MQYANQQHSARSLEWQCLWSCMGTVAWCAADFRAIQPRQLGAARPDFDPGTPRHTPGGHEMQRHRARALCDHRRPCWQRSGRSCMACASEQCYFQMFLIVLDLISSSTSYLNGLQDYQAHHQHHIIAASQADYSADISMFQSCHTGHTQQCAHGGE